MSDFSAELDGLWDFGDPEGSESRFRARLANATAEERAEILTQIARSLGLQGRFEEAYAALDLAEQEPIQTPVAQVRIALERGRVLRSSSQAGSEAFFQRAEELAASSPGLDFYELDAIHMRALVEPEWEALSHRGIARAHASPQARAKNWLGTFKNNLGWSLRDSGRREEALILFREALAHRREQGDSVRIQQAEEALAEALSHE